MGLSSDLKQPLTGGNSASVRDYFQRRIELYGPNTWDVSGCGCTHNMFYINKKKNIKYHQTCPFKRLLLIIRQFEFWAESLKSVFSLLSSHTLLSFKCFYSYLVSSWFLLLSLRPSVDLTGTAAFTHTDVLQRMSCRTSGGQCMSERSRLSCSVNPSCCSGVRSVFATTWNDVIYSNKWSGL